MDATLAASVQLDRLSGHVTSTIPLPGGGCRSSSAESGGGPLAGLRSFTTSDHSPQRLSLERVSHYATTQFAYDYAPLPPPTAHPELLLVGSYQGYLRVYAPSEGGFSPDHVVLETDLGLPVLQVASVHLLP